MKIATWNINGIKARIDAATTWLRSAAPDIACLQEIKCADEAFPREVFEELGYNVAVHGQKGFNGVALLSKLPFDEVKPKLAGDPARRPGALSRGGRLGAVRRASAAQHLSAERQPGRDREIRLQACLDEHGSASG